MALLEKLQAARAANEVEFAAAAEAGDEFANSGNELLLVKNGSVAEVTLTITTAVTVDGEAVADKTIAIPAGETHLLGPWPAKWYNDGDGHVNITYSAHEDVDVAVIGA